MAVAIRVEPVLYPIDKVQGAARRFLALCGPHPTRACWVWRSATDPKGYGNFWVGKWWTPSGVIKAHRFSIQVFRGILVDPMDQVHHLVREMDCIGPGCVAPYHLEVVTDEEHHDIHPPHPRNELGQFLSPKDFDGELDPIW